MEAMSLLAHVGFSSEDHPRYVAVLSQGWWGQCLTDWLVPGSGGLNARQDGATVLVYKACRAACPMPALLP
eukprot:2238858-Amphidinium_carterae.1